MDGMDHDASPPAVELPVFAFSVLQIVKDGQSLHGLKHSDYQRYRKGVAEAQRRRWLCRSPTAQPLPAIACRQYCSRRLRRIYKGVKFLHGRGRYQKKKHEPDAVKDVRWAGGTAGAGRDPGPHRRRLTPLPVCPLQAAAHSVDAGGARMGIRHGPQEPAGAEGCHAEATAPHPPPLQSSHPRRRARGAHLAALRHAHPGGGRGVQPVDGRQRAAGEGERLGGGLGPVSQVQVGSWAACLLLRHAQPQPQSSRQHVQQWQHLE